MTDTNLFGDVSSTPIHIRIQSRNGRKSISSISGLDKDLDLKKLCKYLKKNFKCNGSVSEDNTYGKVVILQGDHRENIKLFLVNNNICPEAKIIIHGV
tara:strand:+ start:529 stop:822 length:294 start_codon:yes stop_codon:yes gene_type:complete